MLTFIGLAALSTSSSELFLSANYRRTKEAFLAAEGAMEYAVKDTRHTPPPDTVPGTDIDPLPDPATLDLDDGYPSPTISAGVNSVTYLGTWSVPAGSGSDDSFQASYSVINTTGNGSLGATSRHESVVARTVFGGG
jgi:Tfp pilus assembly protein PilX